MPFLERLLSGDLASVWPLLAAGWLWTFALVSARLAGLIVLNPIFANKSVPWVARVVLPVTLALVITPMIVGSTPGIPANWLDAGVVVGSELVLGAVMGFGVLFVFAGLRLAGELIDHQAGIAMHEVLNPQADGSTTSSGQLLTIVGTLAFLSLTPWNGHLLIIGSVLDSFQEIPVASGLSDVSLVGLLGGVGQQSLSLALQVAAPVLAAGVLLSWGLGSLGLGTGGGITGGSRPPLRIFVSLGLLTLCLTGITDAIVDTLDMTVRHLHLALSQTG